MDKKSATVALLTLLITIISWVTLRGFLKIIPILIGIISGYIIAAFAGLVDFQAVKDASWIALPTFYKMKFDWSALLIILPAAFVLIPEHTAPSSAPDPTPGTPPPPHPPPPPPPPPTP